MAFFSMHALHSVINLTASNKHANFKKMLPHFYLLVKKGRTHPSNRLRHKQFAGKLSGTAGLSVSGSSLFSFSLTAVRTTRLNSISISDHYGHLRSPAYSLYHEYLLCE